jgi:hypothetical protein
VSNLCSLHSFSVESYHNMAACAVATACRVRLANNAALDKDC